MVLLDENEFKLFLQTFRSRKEIREEFNLSNTESWHLIKRELKYKTIIEKDLTGCVPYHVGILKVYRWCEKDEDCDIVTE